MTEASETEKKITRQFNLTLSNSELKGRLSVLNRLLEDPESLRKPVTLTMILNNMYEASKSTKLKVEEELKKIGQELEKEMQ